ncbi:MAG: LysM peptidoglycan-binding domain-containing protein [Gorillibacterium sp.]|nr:LysM peptidoglycan-binding domain-containing protein [Gorillibacterium sp.]
MTEQGSGLRFDIYERVNLPEGLEGILELEAAELAPHIQVIEEADYAVVKGNLWLTGAYRDENGLTGQSLEHLIPVEITMPLNRIHRLEDIRVVIDQFDVELVTSRSMNVTGVLSLHGLEMLSFQERGVWESSDQEEKVFVYEQEVAPDAVQGSSPQIEDMRVEVQQADDVYENEVVNLASSFSDGEETRELRSELPVADWEEEIEVPALEEIAQDSTDDSFYVEEPFTRVYAELDEENARYDQSETEASWVDQPFVAPFLNAARRADTQAAQHEVSAYINESPQEREQREYRVAFAAKPASEMISHLNSLVHSHEATAVLPEAERNEAQSFEDSVEWKKLFIHENEPRAFKQLRICIVQKEETLESIADRYNMSARQIVLYNRLGGVQVGEGQILYIPTH